MTKPCGTCGEPFEAKRRDARYCSTPCHDNRSRRLRVPERECSQCGEMFAPWERTTVYCSGVCRGAARSASAGTPKRKAMTQAELQSHWRSQRSALRVAIEDADHMATLREIRARCTVSVGGCWEWQGRRKQPRKSISAYPLVRVAGKTLQVHRVALEAKHGMPLGSQQAHHTCANTVCVNPEHLAPATFAENVGEMKARRSYIDRIQELEAALLELDPAHPLLTVIPTCSTA